MAELFDTTRNNITMHIKNIFAEGELEEKAVSKESLLTAKDGKNYNTKFYNLDVIISVGYRVKSIRGTQFRIWANKLIKEYLIKGYNLDSDRMKNNGGGIYFEELLEKIRDIRSSEKVFWRKILDIYATSIDYDANNELTKQFFKTVQNKMHYAVHGNTAAEVIYNRVDSNKENIGLTNFKGDMPTKSETEVAKNYLTEKKDISKICLLAHLLFVVNFDYLWLNIVKFDKLISHNNLFDVFIAWNFKHKLCHFAFKNCAQSSRARLKLHCFFCDCVDRLIRKLNINTVDFKHKFVLFDD